MGAAVAQPFHHCYRWAFAHVVDIALIGDAQRQHTATVKCLALSIERRDDAVNDILRHRGVHLAGKFDEARVDAEFARLPRQIERIDRNAVAADARTRIISGEAERLRLRRLDDLEDVQPHPLRDDLHLVDQPNIRSEEHTSELQSLMRISYAVFCLKKTNRKINTDTPTT